RVHVVIPSFLFAKIAEREFPLFFRIVHAILEPFCLFLPGDVQEELADDIAVSRQVAFVRLDVLTPPLEDVLTGCRSWQLLIRKYLRMNANDQHLFVVRAIEDADAPTLRQ